MYHNYLNRNIMEHCEKRKYVDKWKSYNSIDKYLKIPSHSQQLFMQHYSLKAVIKINELFYYNNSLFFAFE